jgi:histidinol-phosphatase (PHP family)
MAADRMDLPADGHVHSEWSWDANEGSMDATCAKAVALGLPAIAFTEHLDLTPFRAGFLAEPFGELVTAGILTAPPLDVAGYLESIDRCRHKYPDLRILTGLEIGQPHQHLAEVGEILAQGTFDRVIGSLHCLPDGPEFAEPWELYLHHPADAVLREYLAEIPRMMAAAEVFDVFGHIDYPLRSWPEALGPFDPKDFEDELRHALRALADAGCALEINTRLPLDAAILAWWREEGGQRVTFGSDAHRPQALATGLREAAALATAHGFRPDPKPEIAWTSGLFRKEAVRNGG